MALSNTAVPKYYGMFRDAVIRGEIPVCKEISMEMNRIDDLIANPGVYYDDQAVEGWIAYCESELTLTDGSDLSLLDSFKLWGEQIFGWYYFVERSVYATPAGSSGGYISSMKTEAFGRLPVTASGSSSTYEADGMWYNNSQVNYAYVGGAWSDDLLVGPFCAGLNVTVSYSYSYRGAALSCKPLAAA